MYSMTHINHCGCIRKTLYFNITDSNRYHIIYVGLFVSIISSTKKQNCPRNVRNTNSCFKLDLCFNKDVLD